MLCFLAVCAPTAVARAQDGGDGDPCVSEVDPLAELTEPTGVSRLHPPQPKIDKRYPAPAGVPSRHRGIEPVLTTFFNVHTKEAMTIVVGTPPANRLLAEIFRCRGFGTYEPLDPRLIDLILAAAEHFHATRVEVISAYRSPKFNDSLAKKGRRVAAESKHTQGQAIDIRLGGVKAQELGKWVWENHDGGVGTYKGDNFVHVDVGRKRRWAGR